MTHQKPIGLTLYHANWCGHCTVFVPKWEQLPSIDDIGRYIQIAQHEDATITNPEERAKVSGFPTILIRVGSDEYNYTGSREVDDILLEIHTFSCSSAPACQRAFLFKCCNSRILRLPVP